MLSPILNLLDKESRTWLTIAAKKYGSKLFPDKYDPYISESILDSKTFSRLVHSKTPSLVFLGDDDPLAKPLKPYLKHDKKYGNMKIEYFDGAHMMPFIYPEEFSEKMIDFFLE